MVHIMIKTFKVKALKNAIKVGESIPIQDKSGNPGNIGNWIEKTLIERGHILQNGKGPDMAEINVEVKTRNVEATSAHSVGSMAYYDIVKTSYKHSTVHDKFQYQYQFTSREVPDAGRTALPQS